MLLSTVIILICQWIFTYVGLKNKTQQNKATQLSGIFFFLFPSENEQANFLATPVLQWLTGLCSRVTEVTQVSGGALSALQHLRI